MQKHKKQISVIPDSDEENIPATNDATSKKISSLIPVHKILWSIESAIVVLSIPNI